MTPITRQEMFLNAAAGNEQALPDPITREEMFLKAIADNAGSGSGGGGGGGVLVVHDVDGTLDKTWQEIADADLAVVKGGGETVGGTSVIDFWRVNSGQYTLGDSNGDSYTADSANGYPVKVGGGDAI